MKHLARARSRLVVALIALCFFSWPARAIAEPAAVLAPAPWPMVQLRTAPQFTWRNQTAPVRSLLFQGLAYEGKPTSVFAFYATPATLKNEQPPQRSFPAIIFIHGGGGRAMANVCELWARRGYAALALDLGGCSDENMPDNKSPKRLPDGGPTQDGLRKFRDITRPVTDQWPFHAAANVILAHSLLRSFPEIDPQHVGVTGSSWGGFTTCLVAGLDERFAAAAPVYGCGYIFEHSIWHEEMKLFDEMTTENRQRWIELWDPSRHIARAAMPMLFLGGASDFAYPLESFFKTYATAPPGARRWLSLRNPMPHDDWTAASAREVEVFMDHVLRDRAALPWVGTPVMRDGEATAPVFAPTALREAALYFTQDQHVAKWGQRQWKKIVGSISNGMVHAPAPPAECHAWYLVVIDDRGVPAVSDITFNAQ